MQIHFWIFRCISLSTHTHVFIPMYEYQRNIRKGVCLYLGQYDRLRRQGAEEALDEPQGILKRIWMHQACKQAMKLLCRTLVLLWICAALQVWWVLEQPTNSVMEGIPAFQAFMKSVKVFRKSICMQDYGGPTKKPTWLYSGVLTYLVYLFI